MPLELFQVGVDHHLAPLDVRERIALDHAGASKVASAIRAEDWASEVVLLSTCNRTELYVVSKDPVGGDLALGALLRHMPDAPPPDSGCYRRQSGPAAAKYLLRVSCGLESAIVGETEIQGQVRDALARGHDGGTMGALLDRLFQTAVRVGKRARSETPISEGGASHGSATAQVVHRIFGTLEKRKVMVVGAGAMAGQAARALAGLGGGEFIIVNRTPERAEALAAQLPYARVRGLDALEKTLAESHVAILATGAAPLSASIVATAVHRRRDSLLLVDLGVPRCVEATVIDLPGVFLYDIEALATMVAGALSTRREAIPAVEQIIETEWADFRAWVRGRGAMPAIHSMNEWAESIRQAELKHLPADLPPETRQAVEKLTKRLVRHLLGRAAARVVKGAGAQDPNLPSAEDLKSVFGLDEGEKS